MSQKTGGSNDYYSADVVNTLDGRPGYTVQCLEVIETLGMTFAEGEAFKAIWRSCAARTLGKHKADNNARYDAEKVEFYGARMVAATLAPFAARLIAACEESVQLDPDQLANSNKSATHRDGGGSLYKIHDVSGRWLRWGNGHWFFASSDPKTVPQGLYSLPPRNP